MESARWWGRLTSENPTNVLEIKQCGIIAMEDKQTSGSEWRLQTWSHSHMVRFTLHVNQKMAYCPGDAVEEGISLCRQKQKLGFQFTP